jgi:hypothetical protein
VSDIVDHWIDEDGNEVWDLEADEASGDWIRAARLARLAEQGDAQAAAELERRMNAPLYPQGPGK